MRRILRPFYKKKPNPTIITDQQTASTAPAVEAPEKPKPRWQQLTDRHLAIATLPPDDALPLIRLAYFEELSEPFEERAQKRDAIFHQLIADFSGLHTKFADLRDKLPATPFEMRFHRKAIDHDPRRPS